MNENPSIKSKIESYQSVLGGEILFEHSITPMMIVDDSRIITKTNEQFCTLFGYTDEEIIGLKTIILTPSEKHFHNYKKYFEETRDGSFKSSELQYKKKDGTLFWVKLTGRQINTELGHFILWSFEDVTVEVNAREALKNSHKELEIIFDRVKVGLIYVVDDHIERINQSFIAMINDKKENIINKKIHNFLDCFDDCKLENTKK